VRTNGIAGAASPREEVWKLVRIGAFPSLATLAAIRLFEFRFASGLFATVLTLPLWANWGDSLKGATILDSAVTAYAALHVISAFAYIATGNNAPELYFYGIHYNLAPMALYLVGLRCRPGSAERETAIRALVYTTTILVAIGLVLHFSRPAFFLAFQRANDPDLFDYFDGRLPRLSSFLGSMIVGNAASVGLAILLNSGCFSLAERFGGSALLATGALLSLQRSAWAASAVALFSYGASAVRRGLTALAVAGVVAVVVLSSGEEIRSSFDTRIAEFLDASEERESQWDKANQLIAENPLGTGIGSAGHKAVERANILVVPDGNYHRIAVELGIHGIALFCFILCLMTANAMSKRDWPVLLALLVYAFQSVGNNFFDLYYSSHAFWFIAGLSGASIRSGTKHARPLD
jgi:hypothetical protein